MSTCSKFKESIYIRLWMVQVLVLVQTITSMAAAGEEQYTAIFLLNSYWF